MSEITNDGWDDDEYEEDLNDYWDDDFDWCYECGGYGDDYFVNEDGDLESACPTCPHNPHYYDDDWDDD